MINSCRAEQKQREGRITQHVRINVTKRDLAAFKKLLVEGGLRTDRNNPIAIAINRVLIDGYQATFDGMSVGILKPGGSDAVNTFTPETLIYNENGNKHRRLNECPNPAEDGYVKPFYRGASSRVQRHHQQASARRNVKPLRATVSLPKDLLKRNQPEHNLDTMDDNV